MPKITREEVRVPADVMPEARDEYITNYLKATRETGRLMLFACDQKIEHLNKDFYGEGIDIADLERISGPDVMELVRIGRNFTTTRSGAPSEQNDSESSSETTPEPSTSQSESSDGNA